MSRFRGSLVSRGKFPLSRLSPDEDLVDPVLDRMPTRTILDMWKDLKFEQEWVKRGVARVEEEMAAERECGREGND